MANVYISVLGINYYEECVYYFKDGFELSNVRFVQEATVKYACSDWGPQDRILIFLTDDARKFNWVDFGQPARGENKQPYQGLEQRLKLLGLRAAVKDVPIKEGKDEDEIWKIFGLLFESLQPGDEVFLDITHAFRSLPMLVLVVLNYAKVLRKVGVRGIYYGAFEVLGPAYEVSKWPVEKRRAPVFDLTPFAELLDWTVAIDLFIRSGNAALVSDLAEQRVRAQKKAVQGPHAGADAARRLASRLKEFTSGLATCRGRTISKNALELKQAINLCKESPLIPQLAPLLDRLGREVEEFDGDESLDWIRAAKWCLDHGLVQQAYTILRELIINEATKHMGVPCVEPPIYRAGADRAIGTDMGILKDFRNNCAKYGLDCQPLLMHLNDKAELVGLFDEISDPRNDLNHGGMRPDPRPARAFADLLPRLIERFRTVIPGHDQESVP